MDSIAANKNLNKFFNDNAFLDFRGNLPDVLNVDIKNKDEFYTVFLKQYTSHFKKLTSGRRYKIKQLFKNLKHDNTMNCQDEIVDEISNMIKYCSENLNDEQKDYLNWDEKSTSADNFAYVPNKNTVKRWFAKKDYRNPNRLSIYKIAFAFGLKAYLPSEIKDTDSEYKTSINYLFNKVYNQRYATRTADEMIFIYCLIHDMNYVKAMEMIAQYRKKCSKINFEAVETNYNAKIRETIQIISENKSSTPEDYIESLVTLTPILEDQYSSVFSQIEKYIEYFSRRTAIDDYDQIHINQNYLCDGHCGVYLNLGGAVLISELLKKNLLFLNKRMEISFDLSEINENMDKELLNTFKENKLSEKLYNGMKKSTENINGYSKLVLKKNYIYLPYIIEDLIITKNDVYNTDIIGRKTKVTGGYNHYIKTPKRVSHNLIYKNLRSALITAHFFNYWSSMDHKPLENEYIDEINYILTQNFYLKMSSRNSFDSFFILCAKLHSKGIDPIDAYYGFFKRIYDIYNDYDMYFLKFFSDEFKNYDELSSIELLIKYESDDDKNENEVTFSYNNKLVENKMHNIDKPDIQKKIVNAIKNIKKGH